MLDQYTKNPANKKVETIEEVANVISSTQEQYNKNKEIPVKSFQLLLEIEDMPSERNILSISNFKAEYYSFKREESGISASILTGGPVVKRWPGKILMKSFKNKGTKILAFFFFPWDDPKFFVKIP